MKTRKRNLRLSRAVCANVPAGQMTEQLEGAAGGGQGQQGTAAPGTQNNTQNNVSPLAGMWQDDTTNSQPKPGTQQQQAPATQGQPPADPGTFLNNHIATLNLTNGIDMAQIAEQMRDGDHSGMQAALGTIAANSYRAAMLDANKLINAKVESAITEAQKRSGADFASTMALQQLHEALPFTSDDLVKPMAENVFLRFIKKGQSVQDAIKNTGEYFKHTMQAAQKDLQMSAPNGRPGQRGFNQPSNTQQHQGTNTAEEDDWLNILGQQAP